MGKPGRNFVPSRLAVHTTTSDTQSLHPEQPEGDATAGELITQMSCWGCSLRTHFPPSDRQPSLPAPPDMCELLQKSREWLVTADCLWYQRVDTETALKHCCWCASNFCCKMEQYLINVPAGIDPRGPNLDLTVYKSPVEDGVLYIFC